MFYRMALLLLVLAATSAQQLVAQTHWHAVSVRHAVAASASDAGSTTDDGCLLCRIAAHAGAAAPPTVLRAYTTGTNVIAYIAAFCATDVPAVPAHAWQSRGPPAA